MLSAAHSISALQGAKVILEEARLSGIIHVDDLTEMIDAVIDSRVPLQPDQSAQSMQAAPTAIICPSCSRNNLSPVVNREGLRILGCWRCRYSEVV